MNPKAKLSKWGKFGFDLKFDLKDQPENCCEPLKFIMKYISIQFFERAGLGLPFHALKLLFLNHLPFCTNRLHLLFRVTSKCRL